MAKFKKGQSGNPKSRPVAARGLRAGLTARYGDDGEELVVRLDRLSKLTGAKDRRIAFAATELLLAYLAGKPTTVIEAETKPMPLIVMPENSWPDVGRPRERTD
jgi:hypothetical protein